jgi:hypothetical protein
VARYIGDHERSARRRPYLWAGLTTLVVVALGATAAYGTNANRSDRAGAVSCAPGQGAMLYPDGTWSCTALPGRSTTSTAGSATTAPDSGPTATTHSATTPAGPAPTTAAGTSTGSPNGSPAAPTTATGSASGQTIHAYITGYSWFDNTPPGSSGISNPVLHQVAAGSGTYADPTTVAVGHSIINGRDILDWPAGTRFYIPNLRRYFMAEDTCGDGGTPQNGPCHTGYPSGASTWLDVWVGGQGGTSGGANSCMDAITRVSTVVVNPAPGYAVVAGDIYGPAGCTQQFGDSLA